MGESAETALANELWQETGLALVGKPKLLSVEFKPDISDRDHVLTYLCETEGEASPNPANLEIAELGYHDLKSLPAGTTSMATQVLTAASLWAQSTSFGPR